MLRKIRIDIAPGELIDRLTILEIKSIRIKDKDKLATIIKELNYMKSIYSKFADKETNNFKKELYNINYKLWNIENKIRKLEYNKVFDSKFIELARSVYLINDKRSDIKNKINYLHGSELKEVKEYTRYK